MILAQDSTAFCLIGPLMEAAEHAFEAALSRLEVAMVEVKGARERLQMLRDHEQWKRVYAWRAEAKR